MATAKEIQEKNFIKEEEFECISDIVYNSFIIKWDYKTTNKLNKKEELMDSFIIFLEKYLKFETVNSKERKLAVINFIDKLNLQKDLYEIEKNKITNKELAIVSKRFGRKAQSAFGEEQ